MGRPLASGIDARGDEPPRTIAASSSSAISLQEQDPFQDDENVVDRSEAPPSYSDVPDLEQHATLAPEPVRFPETLDTEVIDWVRCYPRGSEYTRMSKTLSTDPVALQQYVEAVAIVRPHAQILIRGTHTETRREHSNGKEKKEQVEDFHFAIDVSNSIKPSLPSSSSTWSYMSIVDQWKKTFRGTRMKSTKAIWKKSEQQDQEQSVGEIGEDLKLWCHMYCASNGKVKTFTIHRSIINRDEKLITETLSSYIRETGYRGHIQVIYPLNHRTVTIVSDHWINRAKNNNWVWWACVLLQLWIITWPILWLVTFRWSVVDVYFKFSMLVQAPEEEWPELAPGEVRTTVPARRLYAGGVSEREFCKKWEKSVASAALGKTKNKVEISDIGGWTERELSQRRGELERNNGGGGFVDGALRLIRGASDILTENQRSRGWGGDS